MTEKKKISLNTKLNLLIISVILTTVIVISIHMIRNEHSRSHSELTKAGRTLAEMAAMNAEYAVYTGDEEALVSLLGSLAVEPDIVYAEVLDDEKNSLASRTFNSDNNPLRNEGRDMEFEGEHVQVFHNPAGKDGRVKIVAPVRSKSLPFSEDVFGDIPSRRVEETIGYVFLSLDTAGAKLRVRSYIFRAILFTSFLLVIGMGLTIIFTRRMVSPLLQLNDAVREIAAGRFDQETDIRSRDEIADLGASFNVMALNLGDYRRQVKERTDALEESNRGLEREIALRKELEAQLLHAQKMEAVGHLAGGIAHDFNNILMAITSFASLLKMDTTEGSPASRYIEEISTAASRASQLTKNLLTFSRKQRIQSDQVDVNEILAQLQPMLSRLVGEHIDQQVRLSDSELGVVADRGQIEQVMMNLVTNARDAMTGGGTLIVETDRKEFDGEFVRLHGFGRPGSYAMISVSDSGKGLPAGVKDKIFEPFFTTKDVDKGTGLGLSIVYGIVKQHHGYVDVYSEEGRGTRFIVYLPLMEGKVRKAEEQQEDTGALRGSETILLAEDEAKLRSAVSSILARYGYRVIEACNGEEAVALYHELGGKIDLLLSDIMMPQKNGKEAYDEIVGAGGSPKTIFMSGYSEKVLPAKEELGEGVAILSKPVNPVDLLRQIRKTIDVETAVIATPAVGEEEQQPNGQSP